MADTLGKSSDSKAGKAEAEQQAREPLKFPDAKKSDADAKKSDAKAKPSHASLSEPDAPPSRVGTALGFAVPIAAVALGMALGKRDRGRAPSDGTVRRTADKGSTAR